VNIRLIPPETDQKEFHGEKEIEEYFYAHRIVGKDLNQNVCEFFEEMIPRYDDFDILMDEFLSMWPLPYKYMVGELFYEKYSPEG